jgi:predicted metal-dependent phosphotriesterase family hydrolase
MSRGGIDNLEAIPEREEETKGMTRYVQTVSGRVSPESLGFTLPHEHLGLDASGHEPEHSPHDHPWEWWDVFSDENVIAEELARFRQLGGTCVVDLTNLGLGREPVRLRRLAERSGLHVVMGSGWYRGTINAPESFIDRRTVNDLANQLVAEFQDGVDGSGIRPGIIGEIGTDGAWLSATEERVFRAVARASVRTGLAVSTHAAQSRVGLAQLDMLVEEGVRPERIVIGHVDSCPYLDYHLALLERGANIEYDLLGLRFGAVDEAIEPRIVDLLVRLIEAGHASQILLSQAVAMAMQLKAFGGNGYVFLQESFLPRLRQRGVTDEQIDQMTRQNPARLLTIDEPELA